LKANDDHIKNFTGVTEKHEPLTWGLALLGQDVVIFIISNMAAVVRAGRFSI